MPWCTTGSVSLRPNGWSPPVGDVRCVYEANILDHAELVDAIDTFIAAGEQARVAATVPMKLCLTDAYERIVLID
jgi:hypothetical protein